MNKKCRSYLSFLDRMEWAKKHTSYATVPLIPAFAMHSSYACTVLHCLTLYSTVPHCHSLLSTVQQCPALSCTVLHCPALTYLRSSARALDSTVQVCWLRCSRVWMRCRRVARSSDIQCRSRNCPGFDPSILRHSGIWGAADEAVLIKVHTKNSQNNTPVMCTVLYLSHIANGFSVDLK